MLVFFALKVKFLLAKKLNVKAQEVENTLLINEGIPMAVRVNRTLKSMSVFAAPTRPKRSFSLLFFTVTVMVFLYQIERTIFGFVKDAPNILANNPEA